MLCCAFATSSPCTGTSHSLSPGNESDGAEEVVMIVGQSAPFSGSHAQTGIDARSGLLAAFALANVSSTIKFALVSLDDQYEGRQQQRNVEQLLCTGAGGMGPAFAIAGTVGSSASEDSLSAMVACVASGEAPVPYIGPLSGSLALRMASTQQNESNRSGVVLARAGAMDEVTAIAAKLASDWNILNGTGVFYQDTPFARQAVDCLNGSLMSLGARLRSSYGHAVVTSPDDLKAVAAEAMQKLYAKGELQAVVLLVEAGMSGALLQEMARQQKENVVFATISLFTPDELYAAAPQSTWDTLSDLSPMLYMSQVVPMPDDTNSRYRVVR
eukprot:m51a1_g4266 hypothetical protein (328) ;mRNA; f:289540-290523